MNLPRAENTAVITFRPVFHTRPWNTPPELDVIVLSAIMGKPGGARELGVITSMAVVAYSRATGTMPTTFPINHGRLSFEPKPRVPPVPQSPTDALDHIR